jgi:transcriptional regulator with XRE-family HTH domain
MFPSGGEILLRVGKCLLADRLKEKDLTQAQLAELSKVSKSMISEYIKHNHVMSLETAINIANALDCIIEDLYEIISVGDDKNR